MANTDNAYGLRPISHRNGAPYNGSGNIYHIPASYATAMYAGMPVVKTGTGDTEGIPDIKVGVTGGPITGVIVGFIARDGKTNQVVNDNVNYSVASTESYALVCDDPDILFSVQEDSTGGALAVTNIGQNANINIGTGSTTSGLSNAQLDSSTAAATATLALKIMRLVQRVDNAIGNYAEWEVIINDHTEAHATTGV